MIYVEYTSRRPGVSLETFHKIMRLGGGGWASDHADDIAVLMLGRTWRLGPEPEYLTVWHSPAFGLERFVRPGLCVAGADVAIELVQCRRAESMIGGAADDDAARADAVRR